jgi:hypothetical protein
MNGITVSPDQAASFALFLRAAFTAPAVDIERSHLFHRTRKNIDINQHGHTNKSGNPPGKSGRTVVP